MAGLLGVVSARVDGAWVPMPGGRSRALLAALALDAGQFRSAASLIDDIWPDGAPRSPKNALQTQVSRLRTLLPSGAVEMGPGGYRLRVELSSIDLGLARRWVTEARATTDAHSVLELVGRARGLWRGAAGGGLEPGPLADAVGDAADRISGDLDALEVAALVDTGDAASAISLARWMHRRSPLDEDVSATLMRVLHRAGRTPEALAVFADVKASLADSLGTDPSSALVSLNAELLAAPSDDDRRVRRQSVGLRIAPNELLGRATDLAAIESLLESSRVTTVVGPGGSGKTRIAHEVGRRVQHRLPVVFVELAPLRSGDDVAAAISGTLGLNESDIVPGAAPLGRVHSARERLRDVLSTREVLVVLDNCEHVVGEVASVVDELIAAGDRVRVLATSRAPLAITAETVYPLPPLTVDVAGSPATELFLARARAVRPGVRADPVAVARLCTRLDGLPLAIELAAARVRTMSVEEIDRRLEDRFSLLRSADRTRPERHRTLHAVIDWSWNLLGENEQTALRRLCRFPDGFTLDAARAVAGFGILSGDTVVDGIDGLVEHSLISVTETDGIRYRMLETVREYGEERSQADATDRELLDEHMVAWARGVAARAGDLYRAGRQVAMIETVESEHDNVLAVLRSVVAQRRWPDVYMIFPAIGYFWAIRGAHSEVLNWAPRLSTPQIMTAAEVPDDHLLVTHVLVTAHLTYGGPSRALARARTALRRALRVRPDADATVRFLGGLLVAPVRGAAVARMVAHGVRSEHSGVRHSALMCRGMFRENQGRLDLAERDVLVCLAMSRAEDDIWGIAQACQALGGIHGQSGRYDSAASHYLDAAARLVDLHAYEEGEQTRCFAGAAFIAAGRFQEGTAVLDGVSGSTAEVRSVPADAHHRSQNAATIDAARAELALATGDIEQGLARYTRAVDAGTGDEKTLPLEGYATMLACACVDAHVLHGRAADADDLVQRIRRSVASDRGSVDQPYLGTVALTLGTHDLARGIDPERALRMIVVSETLGARQDFPSMQCSRHLELARRTMGDDAIDTRRRRRTRGRIAAVAEIRALLGS